MTLLMKTSARQAFATPARFTMRNPCYLMGLGVWRARQSLQGSLGHNQVMAVHFNQVSNDFYCRAQPSQTALAMEAPRDLVLHLQVQPEVQVAEEHLLKH